MFLITHICKYKFSENIWTLPLFSWWQYIWDWLNRHLNQIWKKLYKQIPLNTTILRRKEATATNKRRHLLRQYFIKSKQLTKSIACDLHPNNTKSIRYLTNSPSALHKYLQSTTRHNVAKKATIPNDFPHNTNSFQKMHNFHNFYNFFGLRIYQLPQLTYK